MRPAHVDDDDDFDNVDDDVYYQILKKKNTVASLGWTVCEACTSTRSIY